MAKIKPQNIRFTDNFSLFSDDGQRHDIAKGDVWCDVTLTPQGRDDDGVGYGSLCTKQANFSVISNHCFKIIK